MKKRQLVILGVMLLVVALIVVAMIAGGKPEEGMPGMNMKPNNDKIKYVTVSTVEIDTVSVTIGGYGRVTSSRNVNLTAEVQGRLEEGSIALKTGQPFSKGQLLFRVNDAEQRLSLQSRKSQFLNQIASVLPDLRIDYNTNFKIWEDFFNRLDVTEPMPQLPEMSSVNEKTFLASRKVLSEYYGIKADEERLKKYAVYAPFDGIYTDVMVEVGTVVNPGTQLARIIQYNSLEVQIPIKIAEMKLIEPGVAATVYAEDRRSSWKGKVVRIGRNVNQSTQSVDVFIQVETGKDQSLYEGMYVEAMINCGVVTDASEISRKAVFEKNQVFVVEDSLLKRKTIKIEKTDDATVIAKGLQEGDLLVTEPLIGAREETRVIPVKK